MLKILKKLKKKKGFTLVELLAVIVVLSIIALIGYNVVGNVISGVQESADKENVRNYAKSVQMALMSAQANGENVPSILEDEWLENKVKKTGSNVNCEGVRNVNGVTILKGCTVGENTDKQYCYDGNNATICTNEDFSFANEPNLLNNSLTPVIYDETEKTWKVADTTQVWYNYSKQQWANAVILKSDVSKNVGDSITVPTATSSTSEVLAMYVWIPRYEYKIEGQYGTHTDGTPGTNKEPGEININFISQSQVAAGSEYRLHPAFTWDLNDNGTIESTEHLTGIWVGKFETTGTSDVPTILPNTKALTSQSVSNQFTTAQKLTNSSDLDSHMMKNSEWGSVAYLSQSLYGKYGNDMYKGANKEVYQNKSVELITGSGTSNCTYDDIEDRKDDTGSCGGGASTTGNIYGVYDMSGGAYEFVMGYLIPGGDFASFTSGLNERYFEAFSSSDPSTACNNGVCYGHALSETAGWYYDQASFVENNVSWLVRGASTLQDTNSGVFSSQIANGWFSREIGFRAVLLAPGA